MKPDSVLVCHFANYVGFDVIAAVARRIIQLGNHVLTKFLFILWITTYDSEFWTLAQLNIQTLNTYEHT